MTEEERKILVRILIQIHAYTGNIEIKDKYYRWPLSTAMYYFKRNYTYRGIIDTDKYKKVRDIVLKYDLTNPKIMEIFYNGDIGRIQRRVEYNKYTTEIINAMK